MTMIPCTLDSLMQFLKNQKLNPVFQKETNQIYFAFKQGNHEFLFFFRIYEGSELLQLLLFFPLQIPKERLNPLSRMLHLLNKEIDIPGFGLDETAGVVFHRIMLPVFDKEIDTNQLSCYLAAIPKISENFFPIILHTIQSNQTFESLLKEKNA